MTLHNSFLFPWSAPTICCSCSTINTAHIAADQPVCSCVYMYMHHVKRLLPHHPLPTSIHTHTHTHTCRHQSCATNPVRRYEYLCTFRVPERFCYYSKKKLCIILLTCIYPTHYSDAYTQYAHTHHTCVRHAHASSTVLIEDSRVRAIALWCAFYEVLEHLFMPCSAFSGPTRMSTPACQSACPSTLMLCCKLSPPVSLYRSSAGRRAELPRGTRRDTRCAARRRAGAAGSGGTSHGCPVDRG